MNRKTQLAIERVRSRPAKAETRRHWFDLAIAFSVIQLMLVAVFFVAQRAYIAGVLEEFGAPSEWYSADLHDSLYLGGMLVTVGVINEIQLLLILALALAAIGVAMAGIQTFMTDYKDSVRGKLFLQLVKAGTYRMERYVRLSVIDRIITWSTLPALIFLWGTLLILVAALAWAKAVQAGRESGNQIKSKLEMPEMRMQIHTDATWAKNKCFIGVATSARGHLLWDGTSLMLAPLEVPISIGCTPLRSDAKSGPR